MVLPGNQILPLSIDCYVHGLFTLNGHVTKEQRTAVLSQANAVTDDDTSQGSRDGR